MKGLILSRRVDQTIILSSDEWTDRIEITMARIKGNQASIRVNASKHVSVHRGEIQERVDANVPRKESA